MRIVKLIAYLIYEYLRPVILKFRQCLSDASDRLTDNEQRKLYPVHLTITDSDLISAFNLRANHFGRYDARCLMDALQHIGIREVYLSPYVNGENSNTLWQASTYRICLKHPSDETALRLML